MPYVELHVQHGTQGFAPPAPRHIGRMRGQSTVCTTNRYILVDNIKYCTYSIESESRVGGLCKFGVAIQIFSRHDIITDGSLIRSSMSICESSTSSSSLTLFKFEEQFELLLLFLHQHRGPVYYSIKSDAFTTVTC
jgi:hypothetical protein